MEKNDEFYDLTYKSLSAVQRDIDKIAAGLRSTNEEILLADIESAEKRLQQIRESFSA